MAPLQVPRPKTSSDKENDSMRASATIHRSPEIESSQPPGMNIAFIRGCDGGRDTVGGSGLIDPLDDFSPLLYGNGECDKCTADDTDRNPNAHVGSGKRHQRRDDDSDEPDAAAIHPKRNC